ncbi:radical SAM protein [candidate division KSB1 bacterium]|nr:radical SAM protein [candidate division KSB1 bacterium]TDI85570.1 MAG: radical SAM protein [Caldithrix sp.]
MRITEIYHSIQGESRFAGRPCVFVRTTGCNLRCVWCDTEYAFYGGAEMSLDQIVAKTDRFGCKLVEITGGEPLLQKDVPELAQLLVDRDYTVLVETSGERDISVLDKRVIKIMDLKCPGSGESHRNRWQNIAHLSAQDEVKFVVKDRKDYDWAVDVIKKRGLERRCHILISPVFSELAPDELVNWILQDGLDVRFQLQLHKLVWSPDTKGV